jgi:hypothetical protein
MRWVTRMPAIQDIAVPHDRARVRREPVSTPEPRVDWPQNGLSAVRGIAMGVAIGAAMWCGIGLLLWFLL